MIINEFTLNKLKNIHPDLTILENYVDYRTPILVKDNLGIEYRAYLSTLINGKLPNIQSAVDKNKCFSIKAHIVHNNKYDYSKVNYTVNCVKVTIICPIHGEFQQTPGNHLQGQDCPACKLEIHSKLRKMSLEEFITKATKANKYKYDYSLVNYKNSATKVKIICPTHGEFLILPQEHLKGTGCTKCPRFTKEEFITKANKVHKNMYRYTKVVYINSKDPIIITCPIHGDFSQVPNSHLRGNGCFKCGKELGSGYSRSQWVNFCKDRKRNLVSTYIVRLFNKDENFIKIGITSMSLNKRFQSVIPYSYEVLKEIKGSPDFVWDKEKELHRLCKPFKYKPNLSFGGETECFTLDSLQLLNIN